MGRGRGIQSGHRGIVVALASLVIMGLLPNSTGNEMQEPLLTDRRMEPGSTGRLNDAGMEAFNQVKFAIAHFQQEIQRDPSNPENFKNLRSALFLDDRREAMANVSFEFHRRFPLLANNADFHFNLAMALYGLQRRQEALHHFVEALCLPPMPDNKKDPAMYFGPDYVFRSLFHIGVLLEEAGRPKEAATAMLTVQRLAHKEHKYGPYLVSALTSAGMITEAVAVHEFFKGMPSGVLPKLSQKLATFRVDGRRRFDPWDGYLFPYIDRVDELYDNVNLQQVADEEADRAKAQAAIHARQFPPDCRAAKVLVYSFRQAFAGFGAEIHGLGMAFNMAWYLNRTLVMPRRDDWWYTEAALCPEKGLSCYFEPISSCTQEDTLPHNQMKFDFSLANGLRGFVPHAAQGRSVLFWRGQVIRFLLRPNKLLQQRLSLLRSATSFTSQSTAALHVRRGDRMVSRRVVSVEDYLSACAFVVQQNQLRRVFVSTEDLGVLRALEDATKKGGSWSGVQLLYDPNEPRNSIENSRLLEISYNISMQEYALTAIANLFLMAECRHMVVAFHSHFGRLAYELSYGLGIPKSPPVTVDLPWMTF